MRLDGNEFQVNLLANYKDGKMVSFDGFLTRFNSKRCGFLKLERVHVFKEKTATWSSLSLHKINSFDPTHTKYSDFFP